MGRSKASRQRHKVYQKRISIGRVKPEDAMAAALKMSPEDRGVWSEREKARRAAIEKRWEQMSPFERSMRKMH